MHTMIALVIGLGIGSVSYLWLKSDFLLAGWIAVVWFVAVRGLMVPVQGRSPSHRRGGIVAGVLTALAVGPALLGVSPFLSIDPKLRLALQLLVLGTGFACGSVTSLLELGRSEESTPMAQDASAAKPGDPGS